MMLADTTLRTQDALFGSVGNEGLGWDSLISYTKTSKPVIILMVTGILAGGASQDLCRSDRNRAPMHPRFLSLMW